MNSLGRLEKVPLRDFWKHEAADFTPWLAAEENISLLEDVIGLELAVEAQEQRVGPFRADLLCKDTGSNHQTCSPLLAYCIGRMTNNWLA